MVTYSDSGSREGFAHRFGRDSQLRSYLLGAHIAVFFHSEHRLLTLGELLHHYLLYAAKSIVAFGVFSHMAICAIGMVFVERNHAMPLLAAVSIDRSAFHLRYGNGLGVVGVVDVAAMQPQRAERILQSILGIFIVMEKTMGIAAQASLQLLEYRCHLLFVHSLINEFLYVKTPETAECDINW